MRQKKKKETLVTHVWEEKEISAHVAKKKRCLKHTDKESRIFVLTWFCKQSQ